MNVKGVHINKQTNTHKYILEVMSSVLVAEKKRKRRHFHIKFIRFLDQIKHCVVREFQFMHEPGDGLI